VLLASTGTAAAQTTVSSCGTLDSDYTTYVLDSDITDAPGSFSDCLEIKGQNIVLDGQGHNLTSSTTGDFEDNRGIIVRTDGYGAENVEVRNITLKGWERGGLSVRADGTLVRKVRIENARGKGVHISPAYVDSTNTFEEILIDGVTAGDNGLGPTDGYGILAESGSSGTSNTYTNVTVRNTEAAALRADNDDGDTLVRYNVSGNLTNMEANGVNVSEAGSIPVNPGTGVSLENHIVIENNTNGYADGIELFYDRGDVPANKVAAAWFYNGTTGSWERVDTAKLGSSTGGDFVRVDRNFTAPPAGSILGTYVSDILPVDSNFTYGPNDPIEGQIIEFDASTANSPNDEIVEYRWEFGDGTTVNTTSPTTTHYYDTDGSYTVTLEIEDSVGETNQTTQTVSVDRAERYFASGDGATRTYQISNWTHLDNVREVPTGNFELINDLGEGTDGYTEVTEATKTNFTQVVGTVYVSPDEVETNRAPIEPSSVETTDLGDGSDVSYNVLDADNGTIELTEETDGNVEISYSTQSPITVGFDPIGGTDTGLAFTGELDGNGYSIDQLFVERYERGVGLFGLVGENGTVKNVRLNDANITVLGDFNQDETGSIAGVHRGTIENSSANGSVDAQSEVGGLAGYVEGGTVRNSSANVGINTEYSTVGGLVGRLDSGGTVEESSASSDVNGDSSEIGGLIGYVTGSSTTISESYTTGNVSPVSGGSIGRAGGLVGDMNDGTIRDSYSTANVTGSYNVGGLVGGLYGTIETSYAAGVVNSSDGGGISGYASYYSSTVTDAYWDVNATGQDTTEGDGTPLTTDEMKGNFAESNMNGFDFTNTWETIDRVVGNNTKEIAYPVLRNNTQVPEPGLESIANTENFSVSIDNYSSVVRPGDTLTLNATVENVGVGSGTQTVNFTVNGTVETSTDISLASLENTTREFSYTTSDADKPEVTVAVASDNDTASRNVTVGNAPPEADDDSYDVPRDGTTVAEPGVLGNDTDPNGDNLTVTGVVEGVSNGTLTLYSNGSFEYTPEPGFLSKDTFSYEVTDGNETDTANVTLNVIVEDLRSITYGETKPGRIDDEDPSGYNGEYEPVTFGGAAGDNVTITMTSDGDTYLYLLNPDGNQIASNDDSADLTDYNSRIKNFVLPDTGEYTIVATSYYDSARFKYNLTLEANSRSAGNFSVSIDSTNSPVTEGETLEVLADVENTAGGNGSQEVALLDPDFNEVDSQQVALGPGETKTVSMNWTTQPGDAGTDDVRVMSENDTSSETVNVEPEPSSVGQAELSVGGFADEFPDGAEGYDYGEVVVPVGETADNETRDLNVTLEIDGAGSTFTLSASNETATLKNESENFTFSVGQINQSDTYTATVTANATNANETTRETVFNVTSSPSFDVNVTGTNSPVNETEKLEVTANVTNTGTANGTGTLELNDTGFDGRVRDNATLTLSTGESKNATLTWNTTEGDAGEGGVEVASDNDTDTENVTVRALASFDVNVTRTNSRINETETLEVVTSVTNTGDVQGTQTVTLNDTYNEGQIRDNVTLTLASGESENATLGWNTTEGDGGTGEVEVTSENDADTANVTVNTLAAFEVNITGTNSPVNETETLKVTANVTNTGDVQDTQTVTLVDTFNDGQVRDTVNVTLSGGALNDSVRFEWNTVEGDNGTGDVSVNSIDNMSAENVTVRALASFDVNVTDTNLPVDENEVVEIDVNVTNEGETEGKQTIELVVDGQVEDSETFELGPSESGSTTLEWETESGDGGSVSMSVTGSDDTEVLSVEVDDLLSKRDVGRGELNQTRDPSRDLGRGELSERDDLRRDSGRNTNSNRRDSGR